MSKKDEIPRIAEGKYLKLIYDLHENNGTLDKDDVTNLYPDCELDKNCIEYGTEGKLTTYCLEGIFK